MAEPASFQDLIRRIRAGDPEAAAELVRRYEPTIRRAVRVRLVDARLGALLDSLGAAISKRSSSASSSRL
jgi:RNA polymerase sigma-70 factor (ECF subfamily)